MQWILVPFGVCFIIVILAVMVIPFVRRRSDLLTTWNLFLLGSLNFVGLSAIVAGLSHHHYYFYADGDYVKYVIGATIFFITLFLSYYRMKFPRRAAGKHLRAWTAPSGMVLIFLLIICVPMGLMVPFQGLGISVLKQIFFFEGTVATIFLLAYLTTFWINRPFNPMLACLVLIVTVFAAVVSVTKTTGRRDLLSVGLTLCICLYWGALRYRRIYTQMVVLIAGAACLIVLLFGYSAVRHRNHKEISRTDFGLQSLLILPHALQTTDYQKVFDDITAGNDAVEVSLLCIRRYSDENHNTFPFFTFYWVLTNPIPREFWPGKPQALGVVLPQELGRTLYYEVNWGPGIVGHGFHEGGFHMLIFYGWLIGIALRFCDELLIRQSNNPYLLGTFCAISGQIVAFSRGDIAGFLILIVGAVVTTMAISSGLRFLLGASLVYPNDEERAYLLERGTEAPMSEPQST